MKKRALRQGNLLFSFARSVFSIHIFQCFGDEICNSVDCPLVLPFSGLLGLSMTSNDSTDLHCTSHQIQTSSYLQHESVMKEYIQYDIVTHQRFESLTMFLRDVNELCRCGQVWILTSHILKLKSTGLQRLGT